MGVREMRLIVIGGGYGGTEVVRQLLLRGMRDIEVELISNKQNFENVIGGLEIISEKIKVEELKYDLKELSNYWNFGLTVGNIESIDLNEKIVKVDNKEKDYDILVIAAGAEPNFFNISGANQALCAYHLGDNETINERLKQSVSRQSKRSNSWSWLCRS